MADPLGDLLGDINDLDNALFGRKQDQKNKPNLSNLDTLFGDSRSTGQKKPNVTFGDAPSKPVSTKSALDDLFSDAPAAAPSESRIHRSEAPMSQATSSATSRPRQRPVQTTADDIFGSRPSRHQPEVAAPPPVQQEPKQQSYVAPPPDQDQILRIQRLENEIERCNREIDDLKRRKKEDEDQLERSWREKLITKEKEFNDEKEAIILAQTNQLSKIKSEHENEIERLRTNFDRQVDAIQYSAGQTRDVNNVVEKVDEITATLNKLASNVHEVHDRTNNEMEMTLRLREQQMTQREENHKQELTRFHEEKECVHLLNIKLKDLIKEQEDSMQNEKWKVREEWNRLNSEKKIFKENQCFVLNSIEKQKDDLESSKDSFLREQHDLLIRVSNEKQIVENERIQFHLKRTADMKRLKEEAVTLQQRIRNVQLAEQHSEELRLHYEAKYKQLQELEASLMEECIEIEQLRNSNRIPSPRGYGMTSKVRENMFFERSTKPSGRMPEVISSHKLDTDGNVHLDPREHSVRNVLKKHSDFLERYTGQKVAAVAPQHSSHRNS